MATKDEWLSAVGVGKLWNVDPKTAAVRLRAFDEALNHTLLARFGRGGRQYIKVRRSAAERLGGIPIGDASSIADFAGAPELIARVNEQRRRVDGLFATIEGMRRNVLAFGAKMSATDFQKPIRTTREENRRARVAQVTKRLYREQIVMRMIYSARRRAAASGLECSIGPDDVEIPITCPVLGIRLEIGDNGRTDASPSLDRRDNRRGYVRGNVFVISMRANRIKTDANADELARVAAYAAGAGR